MEDKNQVANMQIINQVRTFDDNQGVFWVFTITDFQREDSNTHTSRIE
jgi:hypothetical protein